MGSDEQACKSLTDLKQKWNSAVQQTEDGATHTSSLLQTINAQRLFMSLN